LISSSFVTACPAFSRSIRSTLKTVGEIGRAEPVLVKTNCPVSTRKSSNSKIRLLVTMTPSSAFGLP
jgi:hypothetical protein